MNQPMSAKEAYDDLCCYTLAQRDPKFLHQHVVDAFAAQNADERTKRITLTFALVGLHLHLERQFSGKQVQRAHQYLASRRRVWPAFLLPIDRGAVTAADVMTFSPGAERDHAIEVWCACVWAEFHASHAAVADLLRDQAIK